MTSKSIDANACFFKDHSCVGKGVLTNAGQQRIRKIIESSKQRNDTFHENLQSQLDANENLTIKCHRNCVSSYTSTSKIKYALKRTGQNLQNVDTPPKKILRRSELLFNFREHCIFCGEKCSMQPTFRNPSRWRKARLCMTSDRGQSATFKEGILNVCDIRDDAWSNSVKLRIQGAVSDLPAADARYHEECRKKFTNTRAVQYSAAESEQGEADPAFKMVIRSMKDDRTQFWTSVDLANLYNSFNGELLSRRKLVEKVSEKLDDEILILSANGFTSLIMFRCLASKLLRLKADENDDDISVVSVAKTVKRESKELASSKSEYNIRIDRDISIEYASSTIMSLLSIISKKLDYSLPAMMIGNMITNAVTNRPTPLQVALSVVLNKRSQIEKFYDFGICCSYDEYLRFKASAASAASNETALTGTTNSDGLKQTVADNFDSVISSPNGMLQTHSLAIITTENVITDVADQKYQMIKRLSKTEMTRQVLPDVKVLQYRGPKKPDMPVSESGRSILSLAILAQQVILKRRAKDLDFDFLKKIVSTENTPEYNGYNTSLCRMEGHSLKPATKVSYCPLVDLVPSDPSTIMTALQEAKRLTKQRGQTFTIFTADQQLYKVAVNVVWVYPEFFKNVVVRLGGMHLLMSFIGAVGKLMNNSGLEEVLKSAFGGVANLLSGKKFPQNVRALRITVEELLRQFIGNFDDFDELMISLEEKASTCRTSKLWLDCLIKPVFLMMMYVRAEREGEWALHLLAVKEMLPYFFAAQHINYARYGLYYLRTMERLPVEIQKKFLKGEHVMRHRPGLWNAIWSDMFIESTFMRYGHGPSGIVGVTLSPLAVKKWALSMHIFGQMNSDVSKMVDIDSSKNATVHKEEKPGRIKSDEYDRNNIRQKLEYCIDPFGKDARDKQIVNIVTGRIGSEKVNVDQAVSIGTSQLNLFEASWPDGFNHPLTKQVVTLALNRKRIKIGDKECLIPI